MKNDDKMNNKKAIEYFYRQMELGNIKNDTEQEAYELAIQALEKQIKRKPRIIINNKHFDYTTGICKNCNKIIGYSSKYCRHCGQKLDWEDNKKEEL